MEGGASLTLSTMRAWRGSFWWQCALFFIIPSSEALSSPQHLVVTVHGLSGFASDLAYVGRQLESESKGEMVVLACRCNEGRTFDGLAKGGSRVAHEVSRYSRENPGLSTISFIGNSLGGLYARYALKDLHENGSIAGLRPAAFVTTAAPHLGVRSALYTPVLSPLAALLAPAGFVSRSARDAIRQTQILRDMVEEPFLAPLRAFRARRAYAALKGDFMVPFDSALFTSVKPETLLNEVVSSSPLGATRVDCFDENAVRFRAFADAEDDCIASALDNLGWSKCVISLPLSLSPVDALPLAHNKVVALERTGIRRIFASLEQTQVGRPVMDDLARWLWEVASASVAEPSALSADV